MFFSKETSVLGKRKEQKTQETDRRLPKPQHDPCVCKQNRELQISMVFITKIRIALDKYALLWYYTIKKKYIEMELLCCV